MGPPTGQLYHHFACERRRIADAPGVVKNQSSSSCSWPLSQPRFGLWQWSHDRSPVWSSPGGRWQFRQTWDGLGWPGRHWLQSALTSAPVCLIGCSGNLAPLKLSVPWLAHVKSRRPMAPLTGFGDRTAILRMQGPLISAERDGRKILQVGGLESAYPPARCDIPRSLRWHAESPGRPPVPLGGPHDRRRSRSRYCSCTPRPEFRPRRSRSEAQPKLSVTLES